MTDQSLEQQARDMLERMGWDEAQSLSAGELVELANLIAKSERLDAPTGAPEMTTEERAAWLAEHLLGLGLFERPMKGHYLTGNGMLEIRRKMTEKGFDFRLTVYADRYIELRYFRSSPWAVGRVSGRNDDDETKLNIDAAYAALQEDSE